MICNAGGRATDDAIRSLVISHKLLGTREWFVIHHTNCGWSFSPTVSWAIYLMTIWKRRILTASFGRIQRTVTEPVPFDFIKWHTITDQPSSVTDDVRRIAASIRSFPAKFRFTVTSTMFTPAVSSR